MSDVARRWTREEVVALPDDGNPYAAGSALAVAAWGPAARDATSTGWPGPALPRTSRCGTAVGHAGGQLAQQRQGVHVHRDGPIAVGRRRLAIDRRCGAPGATSRRDALRAELIARRQPGRQLTIVRPSLIDAVRAEPRIGEQAGLLVSKLLRPLTPRRYRPVTAQAIAAALLDGVMSEQAGERIVESERLG